MKWIVAWVGLLLAGVALIFATCPRLFTGVYAEVTIDSVRVDKDGHYSLSLSQRVTPGGEVETGFYDGPKYLGGGSGGASGVFGWPQAGSSGVMFGLDPEAITQRRAARPRSDRLLVHVGEVKRLRVGERLYLYDFTTADGVRHYGYVEVENWRDRRRMIKWTL